jgi:signal transduction histidine kinase/ABC-type amino acid transport substrate-binding protein
MIPARRCRFALRLAAALLSGPLFAASGVLDAQAHGKGPVKVGVLAYRGVDVARRMWQPTIDYLNREIPQRHFVLVPLDLKTMETAVAADDIEFVLTNTGNYVVLEARYGITRMLTLRNLRNGQPYTVFGAVIFTRADRSDIRDLDDLRGKSFGAVSKTAFGGFEMAWEVFKDSGIDPFSDFSGLRFMGFPQDDIVYAVRDKRVDAGTVRTDTLERMAAKGLVRLSDFKVLNQRQTAGFPFLHSTPLYPEWPFAETHHTPKLLAKKVAIALLLLPADSPAARAGHNAGWTVPLDYQVVHELFRNLKIAPYEDHRQITLVDVARKYWHLLLIMALTISFGVFHIVRADRLVVLRTKALKESNDALEREIAHRATQQAEMHRTTLQLRQREEELNRHRNHLEELVEQRTHELSTVNRELEAYSYSIAHDLRAPLRAVTSFSQILLDEAGNRLSHDQRESLFRVINAGKYMAHLIDDILELSRITRKELRRQQVDLSALVAAVVEDLRRGAPERDVHVSIAEGITVNGDPKLLRVALENLLGNAWKYSSRVEHASIEFGTVAEDGNTAYYIRDNGVGFDMRYAEKLFHPFQRLHNSQDYEGTGVGLATVQRVVQRHGGRIWASSRPGEGSCFYFTLS